MSGFETISAINPALNTMAAAPVNLDLVPNEVPTPKLDSGFGDILAEKIQEIEVKIETANEMVRKFAVGDSVPIHQVTIALAEANHAVELAMQVRTRLLEGYREIMNMQL